MSGQLGAPTEAMLDAEGRVVADARCLICGYNLRTLKAEAACPECGTPVEYSVRGYMLKYAHPRWIGQVARGAWLIVIAWALMAVCGASLVAWEAYALARARGSIGRATGSYAFGDSLVDDLVMAIVFGPLTGLLIVGLVLFTARDPGHAVRGSDRAARRWLRWCLWPYGILILLGWLAVLFPPHPSVPGAALMLAVIRRLSVVLRLLGPAIYMLLAAVGLRYLRELMTRLPRPGLVQFADVGFWGVVVCGVLTALGDAVLAPTTARVIATAATSAPAAGQATALWGLIAGLPSCTGFGFYSASFVLLIMACMALERAAREARRYAALPTLVSSRNGSTS